MKCTLQINIISFFLYLFFGGIHHSSNCQEMTNHWQGSGGICLPNTALLVQTALKGKTWISYPLSPTRAQDGGKSPPATRHRHHSVHWLRVFFYVISRKISYCSTCVGNFPPPTINVSWRQLILETRRKFEISTTLKSLFLFRYFSSVRNNTPVLIASHFASHWLSSFKKLIMPNAATAQPTMMINCLNHSFRVCPLKYSPVQTGNKISQETSTGNIWHLLKNKWRFQTQPVLLYCFKKHIIISN